MEETENGNITEYTNCAVHHVDATWLHVESIAIGASYCYGNAGTYSPTSEIGLLAECGGNNYGYLAGHTSGKAYKITFGPGTTYRALDKSSLSSIHISKWKGTDTCPEVQG